MALSVLVAPEYPGDTYAIYISHDLNETLVETPTETKFDLLFLVPNSTLSANISDLDPDDQIEIQNTVFLPPGVHLGNGTYIIGVKLISKYRQLFFNDFRMSNSLFLRFIFSIEFDNL